MLKACDEGVTEIWLTSEDTGAYGRDIGTNIVELMVLLIKNLPLDKVLRVGMTNPPYILEHLDAMCKIMSHPQVFTILHIPVQAGSDSVLERMNREYTVAEFSKVCDALLANVPDMNISTDIICGFPGETDEEFEGTLSLMRKYKFPVVNISQFYPRPGTVAARMVQCNTKDKKNRSRAVTALFEGYKNMLMMKDRTERVYISERETNKHNGDCLIGHTKNYSKVILPYKDGLIGKSVMVKITDCQTWHVTGDIVDENPPPPQVDAHYFDEVEAEYARRRNENYARQKAREEDRSKRIEKLRRDAEEKRKELTSVGGCKPKAGGCCGTGSGASCSPQEGGCCSSDDDSHDSPNACCGKGCGDHEKIFPTLRSRAKKETSESSPDDSDDSNKSKTSASVYQATNSNSLSRQLSNYYLLLAAGIGIIASGVALRFAGL